MSKKLSIAERVKGKPLGLTAWHRYALSEMASQEQSKRKEQISDSEMIRILIENATPGYGIPRITEKETDSNYQNWLSDWLKNEIG